MQLAAGHTYFTDISIFQIDVYFIKSPLYTEGDFVLLYWFVCHRHRYRPVSTTWWLQTFCMR